MDPYKETFATWNKIAQVYEDKFMGMSFYDESYETFCRRLERKGARVLELGCGPGNITRYLLNKKPDLRILGLDVAPDMIALAQKNNPSAEFIATDCRDLHSIRGPFDAVVAGFYIPYLSGAEVEKMLEDLANLTVDDGLLYLSFVPGDPANSGFIQNSAGDRVWFYYHDGNTLRTRLTKAGYLIIDQYEVNYPKNEGTVEIHSIMIARKLPEVS